MDILVGKKKVIKDGSIVVNSDTPISFVIGTMTFVFDFITNNTGVKDVKQERTGNTMTTHLINFKSSLGTGLTEQAELAILGTGEKLFFSFVIHTISDNLRVFHYTWLIEPVDDKEL
jgi:hypothetical protein